MNRILIISALLLAAVFTATADRRRLMLARNVAAAGGSITDLDDLPNLLAWYRAETLMTNLVGTGVIGQGTNLIAWGDSSGNGYHVTTNNPAAAAPTFESAVTTGIGKGGVLFGSGQYLRSALPATANCTVYLVWRINSAGTFMIPFDGTNSTGRNAVYKNAGNSFAIYSGSEGAAGTTTVGQWYVQCGQFNASGNDSIYTNNVAASTSLTSGSQSLDGITLGAAQGGTSPLGAGSWVVEVAVYSEQHDATKRGQVYDVLKARLSLPTP